MLAGAALWGQRASVSWVSEGRAGGSGWKVEEEEDGIKQSPGEGMAGGGQGQAESQLRLVVVNSK